MSVSSAVHPTATADHHVGVVVHDGVALAAAAYREVVVPIGPMTSGFVSDAEVVWSASI
jgi:hypothetical protein